MIRMRPRFGRAKKKDPAELVKFRLKMVQFLSDASALLKEGGDHELAEELRKTKKSQSTSCARLWPNPT